MRKMCVDYVCLAWPGASYTRTHMFDFPFDFGGSPMSCFTWTLHIPIPDPCNYCN